MASVSVPAEGGRGGLLRRPTATTGFWSWITTVDHKRIGIMHGVTMIFLVVMPLSAAFFNYFIPLQIGARDVAFPRLNAFTYWAFLAGGLFIYSGFFLGGAPNGGWFGYAPLSTVEPGNNMLFYALGLLMTG